MDALRRMYYQPVFDPYGYWTKIFLYESHLCFPAGVGLEEASFIPDRRRTTPSGIWVVLSIPLYSNPTGNSIGFPLPGRAPDLTELGRGRFYRQMTSWDSTLIHVFGGLFRFSTPRLWRGLFSLISLGDFEKETVHGLLLADMFGAYFFIHGGSCGFPVA